jgi:transcription antitermination factor NusG
MVENDTFALAVGQSMGPRAFVHLWTIKLRKWVCNPGWRSCAMTTAFSPDSPLPREATDPTISAIPNQSRWYAAYTLPRHEKLVAHQLAQKSVESYLPLYEAIHRWKDRRARVQMPLFPGYVFVQIPICERLKVLEISSVVRIVSFNGHAAALPEGEMEALRNALLHRKAEPYPYLAVGKRVRVKAGPLQGLEGIIVRRKDNMRIVVTLDSIMQSVALEVDASDLEVTSSSPCL